MKPGNADGLPRNTEGSAPVVGNPCKRTTFFDDQFSCFFGRGESGKGHQMNSLGEAIHNGENGILALGLQETRGVEGLEEQMSLMTWLGRTPSRA